MTDGQDGILPLHEEVTHSTEIYRGKVVHLRVDDIRLPDGRTSKREVVAHRGAVCVVAITSENKVLLVRQFRLPAGKPLLEVPAGTLEVGEAPQLCAERELEEETGYKAGKMQPLYAAYVAPGYSSEKVYAYLAEELIKGETNFDESENLHLEPMDFDEAVRLAQQGGFEDAKTLAAILCASAVRNK